MLILSSSLMKYLNLDQNGKVMAEYFWIDAESQLRSKTMVSATPHFHKLYLTFADFTLEA